MRKINGIQIRVVGAVVALVASAAAVSSAGAESPTVPADVRIPVEVTEQITSQSAHVGDTFLFKTTKDEKLGDVVVPSGSPGHGRIAVVTPAQDRQNGTMALQADSIDLPGGRTIWVNVDNSKAMRGHLSDRHTHYKVVPLPIGIVPISKTVVNGNMVVEPGTPFLVLTTLPRLSPAPLVTAAPTPVPVPSALTTQPSSPPPGSTRPPAPATTTTP